MEKGLYRKYFKYAQRYGEKDEKNRNDLLKVIYYTIIALHNDSKKKKEKE